MEEDETKLAGPKLRWKIFIAFLTKNTAEVYIICWRLFIAFGYPHYFSYI